MTKIACKIDSRSLLSFQFLVHKQRKKDFFGKNCLIIVLMLKSILLKMPRNIQLIKTLTCLRCDKDSTLNGKYT